LQSICHGLHFFQNRKEILSILFISIQKDIQSKVLKVYAKQFRFDVWFWLIMYSKMIHKKEIEEQRIDLTNFQTYIGQTENIFSSERFNLIFWWTILLFGFKLISQNFFLNSLSPNFQQHTSMERTILFPKDQLQKFFFKSFFSKSDGINIFGSIKTSQIFNILWRADWTTNSSELTYFIL
jgi:hypothetical protein